MLDGGQISRILNSMEIFCSNFQNLCKSILQDHQEFQRPSKMLLTMGLLDIGYDDNMWYALYGSNIQEGIVGFGKSPEEACCDFDVSWYKKIQEKHGPISAAPRPGESGG
jgi:hypothetical protein